MEERRLLYEGESQQADSFDKAILTLSAGAFGISLAFLNNIAPNIDKRTIWLLITSWILFSVSILSTLLSFHTSQKAYSDQVKMLEKSFLSEDYVEEKNIRRGHTQALNIVSLIGFFIAIALLALFAIINIS